MMGLYSALHRRLGSIGFYVGTATSTARAGLYLPETDFQMRTMGFEP